MAQNTQKNTPEQQKKAKDWLFGKARTITGYRKKIVGATDRGRDATVIGKMYFFMYDPKHKDTLPIYDRFPLVFPIEPYSDGFLGINLHYISFGQRQWLLNKLLEYRNNSKMDQTTKIKLSYDLLQTTKKLSSVTQPCIKRYLFTHVRSKFIEVMPNEWDMAASLPVAIWESNR